MNRRVIIVGILFGLLLSLAMLYPAVSLVAPLSLDGLLRPIQSELWHGVALMVSAAGALLLLLSYGYVAAKHGRAESIKLGGKMGLIAGLIVGYLTFVTILSPLAALLAYDAIAAYPPGTELILPPTVPLETYINTMVYSPTSLLVTTLLFHAVLGWLAGMVAIWRNPPLTKPHLSLSDHLRQEKNPRRWLPEDTQAVEVAVFTGLIFGTVFTFFEAQFFADMTNLLTDMPSVILNEQDFVGRMPGSWLVNTVLPTISLFGMGLVVVYFMRNPNHRLVSRVGATMLAAATSTMPLIAVNLRYLLLWLGLAPYLAYYAIGEWLAMPMPIDEFELAESVWFAQQAQTFLATQVASPSFFGTAVFVAPWLAITVLVVTMSFIGIIMGALFGLILPLLRPSPVDKAARLAHQLRRDETVALPVLHQLFQKDARAYDILAFVAIDAHKRQPEVAKVAAALHTLGTSASTDDHTTAVVELEQVAQNNPNWQWSASLRAIYHSLKYVLQAKSIEQILDIPPVDRESTGSLPANIVQSVRHLNNIIGELHKVERVDDLRTKIIFLENSLKGMREAVTMIDNDNLSDLRALFKLANNGQAPESLQEIREAFNLKGRPDKREAIEEAIAKIDQRLNSGDSEACRLSPPPDHQALRVVLIHWQTLVLEAIERMKGRAAVTCELKNERSSMAAQVPLVYEISNKGLNVAQKVRLNVLENGEYHLLHSGHNDIYIDILPPGETRQVTTAIAPTNGQRRLRVEWTISYDDAVDAVRELAFADVLEFDDPDQPFERIFPIPYVTGTPLKSDDVFVGREDVFAFIRENLLGTHQNNAIILHGQRRTGKTSVLYRLGRVMTDTHHAVLIDMQGKPARGAAEFLYSIADDIIFTLEEADIFLDPPEREDFEEAPEFFFRNRFLRQIKPHLGGKNLLLLFDEFEELQSRVEDGRLSPDIFTFLRNLMQHEEHVDFVFSGTHKLEQLGAEYWSVLFNIAVYKPITFLSPSEVRRLVTEPIAQYSLEYDPLAIQKIARVTAGHPYFTQLVLHEAIVYHNETERNYLTVTDVDQVLRRIVERGEAHFKYIWAESSPEEQTILRALTECLVATEAITTKQLQKFLSERGYEWGETWETALRSLLDRDIITRGAIGGSLVRFKVDLIRLWIEQTRPAL